MSRSLVLILIVAVIALGGFYFFNQPEPTPAEKLQSAAEQAGEAASDAAEAIKEAAGEAAEAAAQDLSDAASSVADQASEAAEQATETATELATQAGEQVAALSAQGQEYLNTWIENGMLTAEQFDYDAVVAAVESSELTQDIKTQAIKILDEIKAAPDTFSAKLEELKNLLAQQ